MLFPRHDLTSDTRERLGTIALTRHTFHGTVSRVLGRAERGPDSVVLGLTAAVVLVPTTAVADGATHSYVLVMEEPSFGVAPNGDQIANSGEAEFSVNPNTVEGSGSFTHTNAAGTVLATGNLGRN